MYVRVCLCVYVRVSVRMNFLRATHNLAVVFLQFPVHSDAGWRPRVQLSSGGFSHWDKVSHGCSGCVLPVDRTRQSGWPFVWTRPSHCLDNLSENILPNPDPGGNTIWIRNREEKMDRGPDSGRQIELETKSCRVPLVSCISHWSFRLPKLGFFFLSPGLSTRLSQNTHVTFLKCSC